LRIFKFSFSISKKSKGFSLFEVLIAMAIMASSAMLLYVAWAGNQMRVQKMTINNKSAIFLEQIIAELEIEYGNKITELPDNKEGTFTEDSRFTWSMESKDFEMPDLSSLLVAGGQGDEMMLTIIGKLTEHLNESIKEMKVTVKCTLGKKSVEYSATTFLVDYNRSIPLALPGGGQ
jgi:general secretion pathway protein I